MQWVNTQHFKWILCMCFVCFSFCLLCNKLVSWSLSVRKISISTQFTHSEIWKWHTLLLGIHTRSANMKISEYLGVNLKMQRIGKELDKSSGDYEGMASWKLHCDHFDKRSSEFVGENEAMADNNPSKSMRSIVQTRVCLSLSGRLCMSFSIFHMRWKRVNFYQGNKRKDLPAKFWDKLKHSLQLNILWFFSGEKFLPGTTVDLLYPHKIYQ